MTATTHPEPSRDEVAAVAALAEAHRGLRRARSPRTIIGQDEVVGAAPDEPLRPRGHALLVGVPGLASTLLVSTVARGSLEPVVPPDPVHARR